MERNEVYRRMLLIRRFEERVEQLFREGKIGGTAHTCIGQEAIALGVAQALAGKAVVTSTHRGHGHLLAFGGDSAKIMAELFGKRDGYSRGLGGSQMMMVPELGFYGTNGITGDSVAFAAGLALAGKIAAAFFGDGTANEGIIHETLNIAALWKLPLIAICENNGYAMSTPTKDGVSVSNIADRAAAYGIKGMICDGNDLGDVFRATSQAAEFCRAGNGPVLLECKTYRLSGHSKGDPRIYRTREEEAQHWKLDPLLRYDVAPFEAEVAAEIDRAVAFAEASPPAILPPKKSPRQNVKAEEALDVTIAADTTMTRAIRDTLDGLLENDSRVILMGEDIAQYGGSFGATRGLFEKFGGERVRNTPISEAGFVGIAIGAAVGGLRPIVEIMFMDFIILAADQLINMAAKLRDIYNIPCPLVVRTAAGAGRGYGATHSQSLERLFTGIPGLRVLAPASGKEAAEMLSAAVRGDTPTIIVEHKLLYPTRGESAARDGTDVTIIAWSLMLRHALRAAEILEEEEISAEVRGVSSLAPLDIAPLVESARKTRRVLIVEETSKTGGVGGEIAAQIYERCFAQLDVPIRRLAFPDVSIPAAKSLELSLLPSPATIADAARDLATLV